MAQLTNTLIKGTLRTIGTTYSDTFVENGLSLVEKYSLKGTYTATVTGASYTPAGTIAANGAHTHSVSASGSYTPAGTIVANGAHTHTITMSGSLSGTVLTITAVSSSSGSHNHTFTGTAATISTSGTAASAGSHNHTFTGTSNTITPSATITI